MFSPQSFSNVIVFDLNFLMEGVFIFHNLHWMSGYQCVLLIRHSKRALYKKVSSIDACRGRTLLIGHKDYNFDLRSILRSDFGTM